MMKTTFGEYIRFLRRKKGLTLTQLAYLLDLDSTNLSKIENGKREFDEKRLYKLSTVFELNFNKLKSENYGELFAKKMYQNNCLPETLKIAKEKINYLKNNRI